jgi:hypothetical protein
MMLFLFVDIATPIGTRLETISFSRRLVGDATGSVVGRLAAKIVEKIGDERDFRYQHLNRHDIARLHFDAEFDLAPVLDDLTVVDMPKPSRQLRLRHIRTNPLLEFDQPAG